MKLIDLNPRWIGASGMGGHYEKHIDVATGMITEHFIFDVHGRLGVTFDCPMHRNHRLAVPFANPIDSNAAPMESSHLWQRTGEAFDTLSLTPSVDASSYRCWHGFITNGEVR